MKLQNQRFLAVISAAAILFSTLATGVSAQRGPLQKSVTTSNDDRQILHVLNRLGFGARPGDVERVRAIGIDRYIEQQLDPASIPDATADAKTANLEVMKLTTAEIFEKYPNPGALLQILQRRGQLPGDLTQARANRNAPNAPATNDIGDGAMPAPRPIGPNDVTQMSDADRQKQRDAIRDFYIKNGLKQPQQVTQQLNASRILRAVYSERQLQEVMVDFWTNHFNVYAQKGADRWLLPAYDRDTIRPHTMGTFRDLLIATAQSPAMLFYLDNAENVAPGSTQIAGNRGGQMRSQFPSNGGMARGGAVSPGTLGGGIFGRGGRGQMGRYPNGAVGQLPGGTPLPRPNANQQQRAKRGINENYAREIMELHTLGVDGGYTQKDVQEVARCFTGWTIIDPRGYRKAAAMALGGRDTDENAGTFYFNPNWHDNGEKTVLGQKIPAGGGINDGMKVIDILSRSPATAKFLATKLARRFVMDEPTPELVNRISHAYLTSDGDIRATLRAVFASPEFRSPTAYRVKIKTPFELAVSSIRTLGGDTNGAVGMQYMLNKMGEPLYGYQAPTGYPDEAEDWVNTGALLERLNFGLALASNRIPGTRVNLGKFATGADQFSATLDKRAILDRFLDVILQGQVSAQTRETLLKQLDQPLPESTAKVQAPPDEDMTAMAGGPPNGAQDRQRGFENLMARQVSTGNPEAVKIVGLILGSPEFQRQ
jgi:uncharacterized protein (DUF1800 family)